MHWDFYYEECRFRLVLGREDRNRLKGTCFRGRGRPLAGNFMRWRSMREVLNDPYVWEDLQANCGEKLISEEVSDRSRQKFTARFTIVHPQPIGWTSATTDETYQLVQDDLESFWPNRKTKALRVKSSVDFCAPLTREVTFSIRFAQRGGTWIGFIKTIYPGEDIGRVYPTNPKRTGPLMHGVVFFDWNHMGEIGEDWGKDAPEPNLNGIKPPDSMLLVHVAKSEN